jgi:hypothetical protein
VQWNNQQARRGSGGGWPSEAARWRSVTGVGKGDGRAGDSGGIRLVQAYQETRESEENVMVRLF